MKKPSAIDNYNHSLSRHQEIHIKTLATKKNMKKKKKKLINVKT